MRHIPFYYTDKEFPEFKELSTKEQDQVIKDLTAYHRAVCQAVEKAKAKYIDKHMEKRAVIYSHTWGKGHHNLY